MRFFLDLGQFLHSVVCLYQLWDFCSSLHCTLLLSAQCFLMATVRRGKENGKKCSFYFQTAMLSKAKLTQILSQACAELSFATQKRTAQASFAFTLGWLQNKEELDGTSAGEPSRCFTYRIWAWLQQKKLAGAKHCQPMRTSCCCLECC